MEKKALINRWVDYRWEAIAVLPADSHPGCAEAQCLLQDSQTEQWLYPALPLSLHGDEVDDYRLNLSAPEPRLFVVTREDEGRQVPIMISVSYGAHARCRRDGGRHSAAGRAMAVGGGILRSQFSPA
jgi:hypothetical protein